jgi:hypothetical protein
MNGFSVNRHQTNDFRSRYHKAPHGAQESGRGHGHTEEIGMKRVLMGIAAASLLIGAAAVTPAKALPAAPGVIGEPITSSSNAQPAAWVCWWRYGRRVCAWRGHRHWGYHRRHWRHRRW